MISALWTPHNSVRTFILLALCVLLTIGAAVAGIDDNLPGVLLAFLSATAFVVAFIHPWRTSRQFMRLLYTSALGLIVFGILHNVFEGFASSLGESGLVYNFLNGLGAVFFLIALLLCPAGLVVGAVGALTMFLKNHGRPNSGPTAAT